MNAMINDFEDADEAQSHAKTQETSGVSNEGDDGNVLILLHTEVRVLTLILMLTLPKKLDHFTRRNNIFEA